MKLFPLVIATVVCLVPFTGLAAAAADEAPISDATQTCLDCHASFHPGIVAGWRQSRHAAMTPGMAMQVKGAARKLSSQTVPDALKTVVVGCAECHTLRPDSHADTFDHNDYRVHVVVSPDDCAVCHAEEAAQYSRNLMSHARNNLAGNPVYVQLQESIIGDPVLRDGTVTFAPSNAGTRAEACYYCHGTELKVTGRETRDTDAGELEFPVIQGWPNQGVGRINLDGSKGSCAACHTRHGFSMAEARKPYTCKECHVGPDVPAEPVYMASKHGTIFASKHGGWDFTAVPWTAGRDFTAPTCAACHISQIQNTDEVELVKRTHQMSDRLPWRIYGLIYAHAHPREPDTTIIRNADGLPLPTDLKGNPAAAFLIDAAEMDKRRRTLQATCLACHDTSWVRGHWERLENTIARSNAATLTATQLMTTIWEKGYARGLSLQANPFDEAVEKKWHQIWLFFSNSIRFSSAMAGGGDYGVFANGRYQLSQSVQEIADYLALQDELAALKKVEGAQKP
jgi:cytochrome c553